MSALIPIHQMQLRGYRQGSFNLSKRNPFKRNLPKHLILCGSLATALCGCFFGGDDDTASGSFSAQQLNEPSRLENQQTNVSITVPGDWISAGSELRGSADIYASYPAEGLYVSVLSESDTTLNEFPLEDNSDKYRWLIEKEMERYEDTTKTEVTQLDGLPAVQYELRGRVDGTPVVYLHTTVEGESSYYQVVGWTTADRYTENKEKLQAIIRSFDGT